MGNQTSRKCSQPPPGFGRGFGVAGTGCPLVVGPCTRNVALLLEHGAKAEGGGWGYVGVAGVDRLLVGVGYAGIRCTGNYRTLKTDGCRCSRPEMVRRPLMIPAPRHRRPGPWAVGKVSLVVGDVLIYSGRLSRDSGCVPRLGRHLRGRDRCRGGCVSRPDHAQAGFWGES